jgi:4-amino-4-deoxy-L-arabinose transferase-like glycosyltransferase
VENRDSMARHILITASILILLLSGILGLFFNDCIGNDAAAYYIPMAELFAEGKYDLAFNPVIPPLVPFLAGVVTAVLPVSGFVGLKIVAALFMCLGMVPMVRLARRLVPRDQAVWACVLYAVCAQVIRFGITAQLTSAKFFLVLCLIERCVTVSERFTLKGVLTLGVAMALLALCRTEGIFYAALACVAMVVGIATLKRGQRAVQALAGCILLAGVCLTIWSPWLMYEYKTTGYAVLDSRLIPIVNALAAAVGMESSDRQEPASRAGSDESEETSVSGIYTQTLGVKLGETLDGLYVPYLPLVVIGFVAQKKQRWGTLELWLFGAALFNILVIWAAATQGPPILKRYIFPSALLIMPYAVKGWVEVREWCIHKTGHQVQFMVTAVAVVVVVVSVGDGMKQVTDTFRGKYRVEKEAGLWIKAHAHELDYNVTPSNISLEGLTHWTGRSLLVAAAFPQTACWAGAQPVKIDRRKEKTMSDLMAFLAASGTDILVVDKHIKKSTLLFDPNHTSLKRIEWSGPGQDIELYQYLANLGKR